jgi:hypothetical protein
MRKFAIRLLAPAICAMALVAAALEKPPGTGLVY